MASKNSTTTADDKPMSAPAKKISAAEQLRAFEDEKMGKAVTRFDGKVERGIGSLWSRMSDEDRVRHAMLEEAAEAEANG